MSAADVFSWMAAQASQVPPTAPIAGRKNRPGGGRPQTLPLEKYQAMERMLREGGMSWRKIADALDVKVAAVEAMVRRIRAGKPAYKNDPARYTEEQVRELRRLVIDGMTVPDAADQLMLPEATAWGIIKYRLGTTVAELRAVNWRGPEVSNGKFSNVNVRGTMAAP